MIGKVHKSVNPGEEEKNKDVEKERDTEMKQEKK